MKVLYFDYWLKGIKHFLVIDKELKKEGFDTELLHLASWLGETTPKEQVIEGLLCRDISYFRGVKLFDLIKQIKPHIVIGLNLYYITDRTIILACKKNNIPYVYLSHGRLTPQEEVEGGRDFSNKTYKKNIISRLRKNVLYVFPNYIYASRKIGKSTYEIFRFIISVFRNPADNIIFSRYCRDLEASLCLVYSQADKDFLVNVRRFPKDKIKIVGNPEMDSIFDMNNRMEVLDKDEVLLYLEDGSVQSKLLTKEQWYSFIEELQDLATERGYILAVKLHPKTNFLEHKVFFEDKKGIKVFIKDSLIKLIKESSVCVSFYSSTILFALLLDKKVLSPRWGVYGVMPKLYPKEVINYVYDKNDFWKKEDKDRCVIEGYLRREIGEMRGRAVPKIVNYIKKISEIK